MDAEPISERLVRLCVRRSGRLEAWPRLRFHDYGARAAVLVDLALWGRLRRGADGRLVVSTIRTGLIAADRMLGYLETRPGAEVRTVLGKAPLRMSDCMPRDNAGRRRSVRGPRVPRGEVDAEKKRLAVAAAGHADSPGTAALIELAGVLNVLPVAVVDDVSDDCGEAAWIVAECVQHLWQVRYRLELAQASGGGGGSG